MLKAVKPNTDVEAEIDPVERLRASKAEYRAEVEDWATKAGAKWAKKRADFRELQKTALKVSDWSGDEEGALEILKSIVNPDGVADDEELSINLFGDSDTEENLTDLVAYHFMNGAADFYVEADV